MSKATVRNSSCAFSFSDMQMIVKHLSRPVDRMIRLEEFQQSVGDQGKDFEDPSIICRYISVTCIGSVSLASMRIRGDYSILLVADHSRTTQWKT